VLHRLLLEYLYPAQAEAAAELMKLLKHLELELTAAVAVEVQ
jgi:hypothetical protein